MYSTGRYVSHSESTRKKHKTEKTSYNTWFENKKNKSDLLEYY